MQTDISLKIFKKLQASEGPNFLFFISRTSDFKVVSYNLLKYSADTIHSRVAKIKFIDMSTNVTSDISDVLIKNFFALTSPQKVGKLFRTSIICMEDRPVYIKIKPNGTNTAYTTINGIENCVLISATMDVSFSMMIPSLKSITITGINRVTKQFETEQIVVTPAMLTKFNISGIFTEYIKQWKKVNNNLLWIGLI